MKKLSLIIPIYNEENCIELFLSVCKEKLYALKKLGIKHDFIFVNDGSDDSSLEKLLKLKKNDNKIQIINLSKNYGKEIALLAGIQNCTSDIIIPIDVDLQDPPEIIPKLVLEHLKGFDVVLAVRTDRSSDSFLKRITAKIYYDLINFLSDGIVKKNSGDFRLITKKVANSISKYKENEVFMKGIFSLVGFKTSLITYKRVARVAGSSKIGYLKLFSLAFNSIISFSPKPMRFIAFLGFSVSFITFLYALIIILYKISYGISVPGYASIVVLTSFMFSFNFIFLGLMSEYLSKIYIESKKRPIYHIDDIL